jgi:hypothetical protein
VGCSDVLIAAEGGHLPVLQWLRAHHCPWDARTCEMAGAAGHLDVLIWARERDCSWDERLCLEVGPGTHAQVLHPTTSQDKVGQTTQTLREA